MEKITKQLQEILKQKNQLATNLNAKGVSASQDETLNTLVPKVMTIVGGSGDVKLGTKEINEDGEYYAYQDEIDGYSSVNVGVTKGFNFLAYFVGESNKTGINVKMLGDIPSYGFNKVDGLNEIDLTKTKEIANNAFYGVSNLTKVIAPNPVKVGSYAFSGCNKVEGEITISEEQTILDDYIFNGCQNLKINIHDKITQIGKYCFNNCALLDCTHLPPLLEYIPVYTFYKCTNLKITEIPDGVREISQYAFAYCSGIETLKLPDSLTNIGTYVFRYCTGLKELEIGTGLNSLNSTYCFGNCTALEKVTMHSTTPPTLGSNTFYRADNLKLIEVPASALDKYKSASNWSKYADIMVGIEGE